jgi:predicted AAA+ superfamily ATPase
MKALISETTLRFMPIYEAIYNKLLNPPQCRIVWDKSPLKIIQGVRQSGKTRIIEVLAILHAFMCPGKTIFIASHKKLMSNRINAFFTFV